MQDIRWKQRYSNYHKMLNVLKNNLRYDEIPDEFVETMQIALVKSFELSFELMWKLLKDYLEHEEIEIGIKSPKNILKTAANTGLLQQMDVDGDILMQIHEVRNELVHIYDQEKFGAALKGVKDIFFPEMTKVGDYFGKLAKENE